MIKTVQPIEIKVTNRIYGKGRGWVFTQKDFSDLGGYFAVRKALLNLVELQFIRRIAQGLYEYPRKHKQLGQLPPSIDQVSQAIARKFEIRLQPAGAYAANQLGLTEQVPGRYIFLTDGNSKLVKLSNAVIQFKKTTPRRMKVAGKISGLVFEALRSIGQQQTTPQILSRLRNRLTADDYRRLQLDAHLAPAWIARIIRKELALD